MTTYYVDFVNGNNSNNGLGPDASHATNKPWKTIAKAIGNTGIVSGDTVYLSPAGPFRETVSIGMTSPTAETKVIGDFANKQGFKTAAGVRVDPGPIVWTPHLTDDKTAPGSRPLDLQNRNFLTFQFIKFISGTGNCVDGTLGGNATHDIKFLDCAFVGGSTGATSLMSMGGTWGTIANWLIDRCIFIAGAANPVCAFGFPSGAGGADVDQNIVIRNCFFLTCGNAGSVINCNGNITGPQFSGGLKVRNCTFFGGNPAIRANTASGLSTTIPFQVYNNFFYGGTQALIAATSGQIVEDYNLFISGGSPRSNVTAGAHSQAAGAYAPLIHVGEERIWGMLQRPFGEPNDGSPLLGFGNDGSQTATDGLGRPRPAGGASAAAAVGWLGRGNTWAHQTTTVHGSAADGAQITGPGYQEFDVEVDAVAQSMSVWMQFDATYDTSVAKPSFEVLLNDEIGVTAASSVMTAASGTWQQLTLSFTPTGKGIVTVRLRSQDANGAGKAFASDKAGW